MSIPSSRKPERLRYRQGQMLRSRDFRDQVAIEAQLRWWHNRAVHNIFGVGFGLKVSPVINGKDLTAVSVTSGLAYDCFGRELILQNSREVKLPVALPQGVDKMTLLIRYKESAQFPKRNQTSGVCLPGQRSPFQEEPDFLWKASGRIEVRDGVPLALVNYGTVGKPSLDEEFAAPISRPFARPRIASGATIPGSTAWEVWEKQGITIGFQVRIDTSAAGFTEAPCYFAWLQGPLWNQNGEGFLLAPFDHIDEPSINGFVFRLWMPTLTTLKVKTTSEDFKNKFLFFAQKQGLFVCWLGIQPPHGDDQKNK